MKFTRPWCIDVGQIKVQKKLVRCNIDSCNFKLSSLSLFAFFLFFDDIFKFYRDDGYSIAIEHFFRKLTVYFLSNCPEQPEILTLHRMSPSGWGQVVQGHIKILSTCWIIQTMDNVSHRSNSYLVDIYSVLLTLLHWIVLSTLQTTGIK